MSSQEERYDDPFDRQISPRGKRQSISPSRVSASAVQQPRIINRMQQREQLPYTNDKEIGMQIVDLQNSPILAKITDIPEDEVQKIIQREIEKVKQPEMNPLEPKKQFSVSQQDIQKMVQDQLQKEKLAGVEEAVKPKMFTEQEVQKMINEEIQKIKPVSPRHMTEPEITNFQENTAQQSQQLYDFVEMKSEVIQREPKSINVQRIDPQIKTPIYTPQPNYERYSVMEEPYYQEQPLEYTQPQVDEFVQPVQKRRPIYQTQAQKVYKAPEYYQNQEEMQEFNQVHDPTQFDEQEPSMSYNEEESYAFGNNQMMKPQQVYEPEQFRQYNQMKSQRVEDKQTKESWETVQLKIDLEYQQKMKEVSDQAITQLMNYEREHKELLQKTKFMHETSQIEKRATSFTETQDAKDIRTLYREYCEVIDIERNQTGEIFLVDILDKLYFLKDDTQSTINNQKTLDIMTNLKQNLLISSDLEMIEEDIEKNLFTIICAIMGMNTNKTSVDLVDENLLLTYLDTIKEQNDPQLLIMDQISIIKSLINRREYGLNDKQVRCIYESFLNLADNRDRFVNQRNRSQFQQRNYQEFKDRRQNDFNQSNSWKQIDQPQRYVRPEITATQQLEKGSFGDAYRKPLPDQEYYNPNDPFDYKKQNAPYHQQPQVVRQKTPAKIPVQNLPSRSPRRQIVQQQPRKFSDVRKSVSPMAQRRSVVGAPKNLSRPLNIKQRGQQNDSIICVLKVEVDECDEPQLIKVYQGQMPEQIVNEFTSRFRLSERAKYRLLDQINQEINC